MALFGSYGAQLTSIGTSINKSPTQDFLDKIAENCPNASLTTHLPHDSHNLVETLGPQIQTMEVFRVPGSEHRFDLPRSFSAKFCNVEKLNIGLHHADAFFAEPKPNLKILDVMETEAIYACRDTLARVAAKA